MTQNKNAGFTDPSEGHPVPVAVPGTDLSQSFSATTPRANGEHEMAMAKVRMQREGNAVGRHRPRFKL